MNHALILSLWINSSCSEPPRDLLIHLQSASHLLRQGDKKLKIIGIYWLGTFWMVINAAVILPPDKMRDQSDKYPSSSTCETQMTKQT